MAEHAKPLQWTIGHAVDKRGMSHFLAANSMTRVFEGIADEVDLGCVVRVPGFGVWGPWLWESKDGQHSVYPRFVPARPFRLQVRSLCEPASAKNDVLRNFQRSHHPSSRPDKSGSRVWTAMQEWRENIDRRAGYSVRGAAWAGAVSRAAE